MSERVRAIVRFVLKRNFVRSAFLVFFVAISAQLWLWAQWEAGFSTLAVPRPEAVAGIIPVGAWTSFFGWLKSGSWDVVLPAGVVIVIAALTLSLLLKRGFCGWICPVGAFFQIPATIGKRLRHGRDLPVWRPLDLTLRGLRYLLAAMFVFWLASVPVPEALGFRALPYYWVADVVIIRYFVHPPLWWAGIGIAIVGVSSFYGNVWCRWMCPLGGVYGALGCASPTNVVRDEEHCTRCGKCARACPSRVPVDELKIVRAPECDGCQMCVSACPEAGALEARALGRWRMPWWLWPVLAVGVWLGIYAIAVATGHWHTGLTPEQFQEALKSVSL